MIAVLPSHNPDDLADFIKPQDKLPILLALSLNTQLLLQKGGYHLITEFTKPRSAVWFNPKTKIAVVGLRATDPFRPGFQEEMRDNEAIVGLTTNPKHLTREATSTVLKLLSKRVRNIILVGHSLGGAAALETATNFPLTRAISLFGGATATNPVKTGPGPLRATHYHIVGDLISSHVFPQAADIVRVKKKDSAAWGYMYPHLTGRILKNDDPWKIVSAEEEQKEWLHYGLLDPLGYRRQLIISSPIPGSK